MTKRVAVYAGTFDPVTNGHLWIISQGAELFDRLIVAIGINPDKRCMFTEEERMSLLEQTTTHLRAVRISSFTNQYLIRYAQTLGARFILRGIRTQADCEYERTMRHVNGDIHRPITTVFLMPPREIAEVSSSLVKGLVGPEGWEEIVGGYVPAPVLKKLKEKYDGKPH